MSFLYWASAVEAKTPPRESMLFEDLYLRSRLILSAIQSSFIKAMNEEWTDKPYEH